MSKTGQNEEEVRQDFNTGIKKFQAALESMLAFGAVLGNKIAQLIEEIKKSSEKAKRLMSTASIAAPEVKPLVEGLNTRVSKLNQVNQNLNTSLNQLRQVHGAPVGATAQQLSQQLDTIDRTIQSANESNQQLRSALADRAVVSGRLPPLTTSIQESLARGLSTSTAAKRPSPTPAQARRLDCLQMQNVLRGTARRPSNREDAERLAEVMDRSLRETSAAVQEMRAATLSPEPGTKVAENKEQPQIKRKI